MSRRALVTALALAVAAGSASGEIWFPAEDQDVVRRAEAIVVGHVDEHSIEYIPHAAGENEGRSWEHHARLVVSEVLKGALAPGSTPIVIHYGIDVLVDGRFERDGNFTDVNSFRDKAAKGIVELVPSLHDVGGGGPLLGEDMRQDHLWFLRHAPEGYLRGKANRELTGILDEQDVQPLALRGYFAAYLAVDPEPKVREWLRDHPAAAPGALRFIEHCEVQRILREPDPARRVERLLPYFRAGGFWGLRDEVWEAIEACGDAAGPYLIALMTSSEYPDRQRRWVVIEMLGRIRYARAYDAIANLVAAHDASFANWMKQPWWSDAARQEQACREIGSEMCSGITALGQLGDARAVPLLRQVRDRWSGAPGWGASIREVCRDALKLLDRGASQPR